MTKQSLSLHEKVLIEHRGIHIKEPSLPIRPGRVTNEFTNLPRLRDNSPTDLLRLHDRFAYLPALAAGSISIPTYPGCVTY